MEKNNTENRKNFYDREYHPKVVNPNARPEDHAVYPELKKFIEDFNLQDKKVLEIGSAGGQFQNIVLDYTGLDITDELRKFYHKPFFVVEDGNKYPFKDKAFDAIFTISVFEHIPNIDNALSESLRVLKDSGIVLFKPAWSVRSWAAQGYAVRPYGDFNLWGKIIKFSIFWRKNVIFRLFFIFPKRIWWAVKFFLNGRKMDELDYKKLEANYDKFWDPDSDACNSIDPYAAILWFKAHNCEILNYPGFIKSFFVRTGPLVIKKLSCS